MSPFVRYTLLISSLAFAVAGCPKKEKEPTADEILAKESAKLAPKATAIEAVAKKPLPAATGKITLAGPPLKVIHLATTPIAGNATFAFDKDLEDLAWYKRIDLRTSDTMQLVNDCFMMQKKRSMAGIHAPTYDREPMWTDLVWPDAIRMIPACLLVRYLVVVNLVDFKKSAYIDKKTFAGGDVKAEALVFDLDTGAYAGGVAFTAESSLFTKSSHDADLANNFYKALGAALEKALPSSVGL